MTISLSAAAPREQHEIVGTVHGLTTRPVYVCFQRNGWIPVALGRARFRLQIQRTLDPSRTPSASQLVRF
jgi:hypothetical protein